MDFSPNSTKVLDSATDPLRLPQLKAMEAAQRLALGGQVVGLVRLQAGVVGWAGLWSGSTFGTVDGEGKQVFRIAECFGAGGDAWEPDVDGPSAEHAAGCKVCGFSPGIATLRSAEWDMGVRGM